MDQSVKKELAVSGIKSLLSAVPWVGGLLNEALFDYRGRLKQERLNQFVTSLADYFQEHEPADVSVFATEDFSDIFESVIRRVVLTKSKTKHERFRDILIHSIEASQAELDNTETYLDLVSSLDEVAILILKHHQPFDNAFDQQSYKINDQQVKIAQLKEQLTKEQAQQTKGLANDTDRVAAELKLLKDKETEFHNREKSLSQYRSATFYHLTEEDFRYYKQILTSKGLLSDTGIGAIGGDAFIKMSITEFGKRFINFIKSA